MIKAASQGGFCRFRGVLQRERLVVRPRGCPEAFVPSPPTAASSACHRRGTLHPTCARMGCRIARAACPLRCLRPTPPNAGSSICALARITARRCGESAAPSGVDSRKTGRRGEIRPKALRRNSDTNSPNPRQTLPRFRRNPEEAQPSVVHPPCQKRQFHGRKSRISS